MITPTISLMQDQTHELHKVGIKATYLGSAQFAPNAERGVFSQDTDCVVSHLVPAIPLMALSATVIPEIQRALETFLHNPVVK